MTRSPRQFVAALPPRGATDDYVRVLVRSNRLRLAAYGTRRGTRGIPPELTRLRPAFGACAFLASKIFPGQRGESVRFRLHPWFDRWVRSQMEEGEHVVSSYGYANACFEFAHSTGGRTFLDAGNSHPQYFWDLLCEEHRRWGCPTPPVSRFHYERSLRMMEHLDYVLSPSSFVANSFLQSGFSARQILKMFYPVDLSCFFPAPDPRPPSRPLTIISTGALSLRKGTPYMLEAFQQVHRRHPSARFQLTASIHDSVRSVVKDYANLPIDWSPPLPHPQLAERLRSADIFVLPSLEEGLVRTALEAMACGLPVILTPNTGANDYVASASAGRIVPIRDSNAIVDAVFQLAEIVMSREGPPLRQFDPNLLSFERFESCFLEHLENIGI